MRRYSLRDDQWDRIKDILPGREGHVGGTAADNRLFVEAVLFGFEPVSRGAICRAHFRAIATRYDKLDKIFLAGVQLACAVILLN